MKLSLLFSVLAGLCIAGVTSCAQPPAPVVTSAPVSAAPQKSKDLQAKTKRSISWEAESGM